MTVAIGIDGCKNGWFYFRFADGVTTYGVAERLADILADEPPDANILIDIPIGLPESGKDERRCDLDARVMLKPRRHTSVSAVPCRQAVYADTYEAASKLNKKITGRKLSRQSWGISPKIREVDELLGEEQGLRDTLRECHPELAFCGLAGGPMANAKKTREGFDERMTILQLFEPDTKTLIASAYLAHGEYDAARDDIIDAYVLAFCARHPERLRTVPGEPPSDSRGLPMQMVYMTR
jgi:predicted RNase H-like nuclease